MRIEHGGIRIPNHACQSGKHSLVEVDHQSHLSIFLTFQPFEKCRPEGILGRDMQEDLTPVPSL